jgi:hypothetical protein
MSCRKRNMTKMKIGEEEAKEEEREHNALSHSWYVSYIYFSKHWFSFLSELCERKFLTNRA